MANRTSNRAAQRICLMFHGPYSHGVLMKVSNRSWAYIYRFSRNVGHVVVKKKSRKQKRARRKEDAA